MADVRISQLTALTSIATGDLIPVVDISDTTDSAEGTTKKITQDNLIPDSSLTVKGKVELATTAEINTGTDSTRAMPVDQYVASNRNVRYVMIRSLDSSSNCAVGTTIGGDFECPLTGTITAIGGFVDTAGTTGTMVVDVNKNGTTLMTSNKLSFDTTEKTTRTAATAPALTTTSVTAGDIFTVDIDSIHTTPAKGLSVRIEIRLT